MDFSEYNEVVGAWIKQVLNNRGVNAGLTIKCCQDIEQYACKTNDSKLLGFAYYFSGETYYVLNDGDNLFKYITRSLSYLDQSEQWELVVRAYNILAITSINRGNAPIAMDYYLTGLSYCRKYRLYQAENIINLNLGSLYLGTGQYNEAQKYFENVYHYISIDTSVEGYFNMLTCVYTGLGKCELLRGMLDKAKKYLNRIDSECWGNLEKTEKLSVLCFRALYYHSAGNFSGRDECIRQIHENTDSGMAVMDVFDDFYEFCRMLLEIDYKDEFWDTLNILEELTRHAKIINLQRRIISLKIKYYRKNGDNAGYLQAAGLYYELTEVMERENQYMVTNMLNVRSSLERANEKRREVEKANEKLQEKSETDPLTHLANRFKLNDYSENAFERAVKNGTSLAVEILDIDYFKQFNDNYGHQAGDDCIQAIAGKLNEMQSDKIFCARYGGDEFIIIYEDMTEKEVMAEAEKLRKCIAGLKPELVSSKAPSGISISQGICFDIPGPENKNWDFLHVADMMLYRVKKKCRNSIQMGYLDESEINIEM